MELIARFESVVISNQISSFTAKEYKSIIHYYGKKRAANRKYLAVTMAFEAHPKCSFFQKCQIKEWLGESNFQAAEKELRKMVPLILKKNKIILLISEFFSLKKEPKKSIKILEKALHYVKKKYRIKILSALIPECIAATQIQKAKKYLLEIAAYEKPKMNSYHQNLEGWLEKIIAHGAQEDSDMETIAFLWAYAWERNCDATAWYYLGSALEKCKEYKSALVVLDRTIACSDTHIAAHLKKAAIYEALNEYQNALYCYRRADEAARKDEDSSAFVQYKLGYCSERLGYDFKDAIFHYKKSLDADSTYEKSLIRLGKVYQKIGDYTNALRTFKKLCQLYPDNQNYLKFTEEVTEQIKVQKQS